MSFSRSSTLAALVLVLASASAAQATVVSFSSRAAFDAAFPGSVRENWDSFAAGTTFPDGTTSGGITYSTTGADALVTDAYFTSSGANGLGATDVGFFLVGNDPTFAFSSPLHAFGIDINTFATGTGDYTATTNLGDVIQSVFDPFPGLGTGEFVGFSSDVAFTSVTIAAPGQVVYTLDTLRAVDAAPVPEPSTLALLGAGLAGLGAMRRRRKAKAQAGAAI